MNASRRTGDSRELYPILEFDPEREALIEPARVVTPIDAPEYCVICFFQEVISTLCREGGAKVIACEKSEVGEHPVYEITVEGKRCAVIHPGIGAPFAAALLEYVIALGCRKFIACGSAGVLDEAIAVGHIVVPSSAVRDEGTSYHYLPPGREVNPSPEGLAAIEKVLTAHGRDYVVAKTWTTDAFYRETPGRIARRRSEGCLTVEMEASALFAVAEFRGLVLAQMLYGGDDVSSNEWDPRGRDSRASVRKDLFQLAVEACLAL